MEHLLSPEGARPIDVPYVGTEYYEAYTHYPHGDILTDFKSYFESKGWSRNSNGDLVFGSRTSGQIASFLQEWLYFGCLISVLRRVGIGARTNDFIRVVRGGRKFVCTSQLQAFIVQWAQLQAGGNIRSVNNPKYICGENVKEILNWTFYYLGMLGGESRIRRRDTNDPLPLIKMSIMAMGESLCSALVAIHGYEAKEMPTWGPSVVLKDRLRDSGWCVSDSPFFPESLTKATICSDYYFGGYRCPRERGDHGECSEVICRAYQTVVDTSTYRTMHVPRSCYGCDHVLAPDGVVDIVRNRGIPVILWRGGSMHFSAYDGSTKYVAVSHVWSDGLGNDDEHNSLPTCQLSRIQALVDGLYVERHRSSDNTFMPDKREDEEIGFWIDTLCVPVGKHNSSIRKSAIRQMADIYHQADRVLVIDSFVQQIPRSANIVDKYARIHLSNWHHRLWTLQEGQLARTLFFQFKDGAETFADIRRSEDLYNSSVADICSPVRHLCSTELEAFYRYFEKSMATSDIVSRMRSCAKYLRSRQTSRMEDEPLCVATILGLDPQPMLAHSSFEKRMESFYDLIGRFDPRIIFNDHPRLRTEGYGWAPRSFLHQLPDVITMRERGMDTEMHPVTLFPNGGGLPVQFPGFELSNVDRYLGSSILVVPRSDGVPYTQRLSTSPKPWWKQRYRLQLVPGADGSYLEWDASQRYVIVMYTDLHPDFLPAPAILGTMETWQYPETLYERRATEGIQQSPELERSLASDRPRMWLPVSSVSQRITVRCVCRAIVDLPAQELLPQRLDEVYNGMYPVLATVYGRLQKWRIL